MRKLVIVIFLSVSIVSVFGQNLTLKNQTFELVNVTGSITKFQGKNVLKIERDFTKIPFDESRLEATVDEPTYAKLTGLDFDNGTIEVKMYAQIQDSVAYNYKNAQGFIGVAFRISEGDTAFESIYLRPKVGRSNDQMRRNHAVQYFAYPNAKFETLRKRSASRYEGSAPVNINEWITMRIEVNGETAEMFINDARYSTFIVDKMLGSTKNGSVALWVEIGTIGYFKDLKVTKRPLKNSQKSGEGGRDI
jgi:hypothetical protein